MKKENDKIDLIDTIVGQGILLEGALKGDGNIRIDGRLSGGIEASGDVYIGKKAEIVGDCHVGSIIIGGKIQGNIVAQKRVEVLPSGELYGNILAPRICIADGVIFEGNCKISR